MKLPARRDVEAAFACIASHLHYTPVLTSTELNGRAGCDVFFKGEMLQKVGAFKARGACHAVMASPFERIANGVATHSSGNHGAALAWAARLRHVPAYVVVPDNASLFKRSAIERYGARVIPCGPTLAERESALAKIVEETVSKRLVHTSYRLTMIHASLPGRARSRWKFRSRFPILMRFGFPLEAGGCIAALTETSIRVVGAEPETASDAAISMRTGVRQSQLPPKAMADGLRTSLGELNFRMLKQYGLPIHLVSEAEIVTAQNELMSILKVLVEPSSAVPWVALRRFAPGSAKRVGIVLTGGNIEMSRSV